MTTLDVKLNISDEVLAYLQREAGKRQIALDTVISELLVDYFDEPSRTVILENIRQAMREGLAGDVRPVDDVLAELKQEFDFDADES